MGEGGADAPFDVNDDSATKRSAALDGWVAAFDREMEQSGDFATSVAAMTEHGCFDVRAVVERWILANPTGTRALAPSPPEGRRNPQSRNPRQSQKSWNHAAGAGCRAAALEAPALRRPPTSRISTASCKAGSSALRSTRPFPGSGT